MFEPDTDSQEEDKVVIVKSRLPLYKLKPVSTTLRSLLQVVMIGSLGFLCRRLGLSELIFWKRSLVICRRTVEILDHDCNCIFGHVCKKKLKSKM